MLLPFDPQHISIKEHPPNYARITISSPWLNRMQFLLGS
jgi:hypothetical protein